MDRGAWWTIAHGVTESRARLSVPPAVQHQLNLPRPEQPHYTSRKGVSGWNVDHSDPKWMRGASS